MKVNLIGDDGKLIGSFTFEEVRALAKAKNMDLILLNGKTNTYKIADAGKLKYDQRQKEKQIRVNKKSHKIKEIKIRPVIESHDLEVKINHLREFLKDGFKTKLIMTLKGRQIVHKDLASKKFSDIINMLINEGIASLESPTKTDGRELSVLLIPIKKI